MKKGEMKKKIGFTIIETSLVLAIAGLILLMVFVALPALQRSQRNAKRKDDIMTFLSAVKKYQSNNRGALPNGTSAEAGQTGQDNTWQGFYNSYLGDSFEDPSGPSYELSIENCGANKGEGCKNLPMPTGTMDFIFYIYTQATCNSGNAVGTSNPKNLAVMYQLEGTSTYYCANT